MIRAFVFDCFGVFYEDSVFAYSREPGSSVTITAALSAISGQASMGNMDKTEYVKKASMLLGKPADAVERQFFVAHNRNKEVVELIYRLRRAGLKTGLLSNIGSDMIGDFFTPDDYTNLFDAVVISADVGMVKPDPRIYKLMCSRLGIDTDETVMVDDIPDNIVGAVSSGLKGIRYKTFTQLTADLRPLLPKDFAFPEVRS